MTDGGDTRHQFYSDYLTYARDVLEPSRDGLRTIFKQWKDLSYWASLPGPGRATTDTPVQRAFTRIKRPESAEDKLLRKPEDYPDGVAMNSVRKMCDALGGRIVVYFLTSLPLVDAEIRRCSQLEISPTDPPKAYLSRDIFERIGLSELDLRKKDSGYSSLHYVVRFKEDALLGVERPWFEIQVRTLVEDVWGEIEHVLGYKPHKRTAVSVRRQFKIIANQLTAIDEYFDLLRELQSQEQERASIEDDDALLNAENLPKVLSEWSIGVAQGEIDSLLKLLASRGFKTIGDFRNNAANGRVDMIRTVFLEYEKRLPRNFETVSNLATIRGLPYERIRDTVKTQIDVLNAWHNFPH